MENKADTFPRWSQYFNSLLNGEQSGIDIRKEEENEVKMLIRLIKLITEKKNKEEMSNKIQTLKKITSLRSIKSPKENGLPAKILQQGEKELEQQLN